MATESKMGSNEFNFGHGSGNPGGSSTLCTLYESYIDEITGRVVTQRVIDPETNKPIQERFSPPYSGCTDTHTYLYFINEYVDKGQKVYFYNPRFPEISDYENIIDEQVEKEVADYFANTNIYVVD